MKATIGAIGAAATAQRSATARALGANDRIGLAVIGGGTQSGRVLGSFARHRDVRWLAGCDVHPTVLDGFLTPARQTFTPQMVSDYRHILDRKDIDAVVIGAPDGSHVRVMVDAIAAGKDVYIETLAVHTVEEINAMLDASRTSQRIVQIGIEHRSGGHVTAAKAIIDRGQLGAVRHVAIVQPGRDANSRSARHVDVAHWFMNADLKVPAKTAAIGLFRDTPYPAPNQRPDTFSISWEYDDFVMTFANGEEPRAHDGIEGNGTFFIGCNGSLQVGRMGYALRPPVPRASRKAGPLPTPTATRVRRDGAPVERNVYINPRGADGDDALDAHVKNFLDCMHSRRQPNAHMEIGYHSALPGLLALESMRRNRALGWDAAARRSQPL